MALGGRKAVAPQDALRAILRERRLEAGLTQDQLAFLAGYDRSAVIRIENGERIPQLPTILNLCTVLRIHPATVIKQLSDAIGFEILSESRIKQMLDAERRGRPPKRYSDR